jgi:glucose-6-phosphate 1-epimerase
MNTILAQAFGGQITQTQLLGCDLFYQPAQPVAPPTPLRAGVPIMFPQFAATGPLTKHGFVRTADWQVFSVLADCVSTSLLLTEQPDWPYRAQLNMDAHIEDDSLEIFFEVRNVCAQSFTWTGGLHPYFLVGDVTKTHVNGLMDAPLYLSEHGLAQHDFETHYPITGALELHSPKLQLKLEQTGFDHWMVWNAGGAHQLTDIPHDDWRVFLCVEPICLTPQVLQPDELWTGSFKITLI